MKALLFLFLIVIASYGNAELVTGGGGKFAWIEKTGSGYKINPGQDFRNPKSTQFNSWTSNSAKFNSVINGNSGIRNAVGAYGSSSIPTSLGYSVEKKAVIRSMFTKVQTYASLPVTKRAGWVGLAASIAIPYLIDEFVLDDSKGAWLAIEKQYYVAVKSGRNLDYWGTFNSINDLHKACTASAASCSVVYTMTTKDAEQNSKSPRVEYCKTVTWKNSYGEEVSSDGSLNGNQCSTPSGSQVAPFFVATAVIREHREMTYADFERLTSAAAEANPTQWVHASPDVQGGAIPSLQYLPEQSYPTSSVVVQTAPYHNPITQKAEQTTFNVKSNSDKSWSVSESVTMRPDLQGDKELAPESKIPTDVETKPKPDSQASTPVQCDIYPDSLGCVDVTEETQDASMVIPQETVPLDFKVTNYITSSTGTCPQGSQFTINFFSTHTYEFSFEPVCKFAEMIKYALWVCSWLIAYYIVIGRPE